MPDTSTTHIGSDYIAHTDPKTDAITVELVAHHSTCETTGKIPEYKDLVKTDTPVWTNSMCNELGRLSQGRKAHTGLIQYNLSSKKTNQMTEGKHI